MGGYQNFLLGLFADHLWFLLALFWATLSCVLLLPMLKKHLFTSIIIVLLMALAVQLFLGSVPYYKLYSTAQPILCFGFGMFFYHAKDWIETLSASRRRAFLITLFISMVILIYFDRSIMSSNLYLGWLISVMGCVLAYYMFEFLQDKSITSKVGASRFYKWIDSHNMEYYLFHMPFPLIFFIVFYPVLGIPPVPFICLTFLFTFMATTIVVWIISRIKQQKRFVQIVRFPKRGLPQND